MALLGELVAPPVADSQLLWDNEDWRYINYADQGYRPYTGGVWSALRRPTYDALGNFLMEGVNIWETEEGREDEPLPGSIVTKTNEYRIQLNRLVIAHDTYGDWSSRLMVGDDIRTKFSALTLDLASLNGVRWDTDFNPIELTLVSSRIDYPIFASGGFSGATTIRPERDAELNAAQRWATYLLGAHVERQIGAVNLGFNYVNLHRTDTLVDWGDNSFRGVLPSAVRRPPAYIAVRIADGADQDGRGARVYDVRIVDEQFADVRPDVTRHDTEIIDPTYPNGDQHFPTGREIPPYVQYLKGDFAPEAPGPGGYLEADGTEYLVYWFKIPQEQRDNLEELEFEALVADDYLISLSEVFLPISVESTSNPAISGERATYWYPVAGSAGRVSDQSNLRRVRFRYGRQSGRTIGSARLEYERAGFEFTAELARTWDFRQYPTSLGRKVWHTQTSDAWFVTFQKQLDAFAVGGEWFHVAPLYSTMISVEDPNYSTYTDDLESPFSIFPDFPQARNNTVDLHTVDDNDDKDLAPDQHFLPHLQDGSVLPGRDLDLNGRIDDNENANKIPDYLEPFFLYNSDPAEFEYGDDLNNNGIIDHREDDLNPDYPYDVDLEGFHLFVDTTPARSLKLRLGAYRTEQIWGGGRNDVTYARLDYDRAIFPYGRLRISNNLKRVEDNIQNDTPQLSIFAPNQIPLGPGHVLSPNQAVVVEDELRMRDSFVNTAYVDATFFRIRGLNVNSRFRYQANFQQQNPLQPDNRLTDWSWVLRTDYTWTLGRLSLSPKAKYMAYGRSDREDRYYTVAERYFYPMFVAQFTLTDRTDIKLGAQGFPFLKSTFGDRTNPDSDYSSTDYIATVSNRTTYQGQHLMLNMGYHVQVVEFDARERRSERIDRALFFLRLVLGLEPFQG